MALRALAFDPRTNQSIGVYNQNQFSLFGRWSNKTLAGKTVVGPLLNGYDDVNVNTGLATISSIFTTPSGRQFTLLALGAGTGAIALSSYSYITGKYTYVGRQNIVIPGQGAPTMRGWKADDTDPNNIKIFFGCTQTSGNIIYGGLTIVNKLTNADFVQVGPTTLPFATGSDQKAVYFISQAGLVGSTNPIQAMNGFAIDTASKKVYIQNGTGAAWQWHVYDYTNTLNNVSQPVDSFTVASPGVVNRVAHGYLANEAILFNVTSGALPTGITANTVYYVISPTANDFRVSATPSGTPINFTAPGAPVSPIVRRAFGTSMDLTYFATGTFNTGGTLLANNSIDFCNPTSGHLGNNGVPCVAFATTAALYLCPVSNITPAAASLPGLATSNILGNVGVYMTAPVITAVNFSDVLDAFVMLTSSGRFVVKKLQNNQYLSVYGVNNLQFLSTLVDPVPKLGALTFNSMDLKNGVLFAAYTSTNQAGTIACDLSSDSIFDQQYIITPVFDTENFDFKAFAAEIGLAGTGNNLEVSYKTSNFANHLVGWSTLPVDWSMLTVPKSPQIQFKIAASLNENPAAIAAQMCCGYVVYSLPGDGSDQWAISVDNSSSGSPTRIAARLMKAYPSAVPTSLKFKIFDTAQPSQNLLYTFDLTVDSANFQYSTNDGSTYNPLGVVPNVVGTILRLTMPSPPGIKIMPVVEEP